MNKIIVRSCAVMVLLAGASLQAQDKIPFDNSGNGMLNGNYVFRQMAVVVGDNAGNLNDALTLFGTISFDGNGKYSMKGTLLDGAAGASQQVTRNGTYTISAAGLGNLSNPLTSQSSGVFGLVSNGVFMGSSTEDGLFDLLIAAPAATASTGDFKGQYWVAEMSFPSATISQARDAFFQLNPDGQGGLGRVNLAGYVGGGDKVTQSLAAPSYSLANGSGTLTLTGSTSLVSANQRMYMSPDGNLIFGGSDAGFDFFIGVRALAGKATASTLSGLYYQAGTHVDETTLADGYATPDAFYGAFSAGNGIIVGHQRLDSQGFENTIDFTYSDSFALADDGSYDDADGFHNVVGAGGAVQLGFGQKGFIGITVALRAPSFSGMGVYLNPTGILNGGSSAPFTVGVSPGALMTLYGTGLAASTQVDATFPTTLNGVQVTINGRPAPIYVVSAGQISVLVPWATSGGNAAIQVTNNGVLSNTVTVFVNATTPGVFTIPPGGVGPAAALHADGSLVSSLNKAKAGETVSVFLTGLGAVTPAIDDGAVAPSSPLSLAGNKSTAFLGGAAATVLYQGLAPQLRGLYQMNVTVPANAAAGNLFLAVVGPDSYTSQAWIPVAGVATGAGQESAARESVQGPRRRAGTTGNVRRTGGRP